MLFLARATSNYFIGIYVNLKTYAIAIVIKQKNKINKQLTCSFLNKKINLNTNLCAILEHICAIV